MASQYDEIGLKYSGIKRLATSMVEEENVRQAMQPYLTKMANPRVLDLACGTGYYSKKPIDWGAGYVLGTDQSQAMVDAANDQLLSPDDDDGHRNKYEGKVAFKVGDALSQGRVEGEEAPFDMVIGCWLLNYAANLGEMAKMFSTISANLKQGGVFVGLMPAVVEDVDDLAARWPSIQDKFPADFPVRIRYYERLPSGEGWKTEITNTTAQDETITFRNFHLKKSVYEEGARAAGFAHEKLEWRDLTLSEPIKAHLDHLGWTAYFDGPDGRNIGILIVGK